MRDERLFPSYLTEDTYFEQSASDEPYRKVVYETRYQYVDVTDPAEPSSGSERSETLQGGGWLGWGLTLVLILALGLICWWGFRRDSGGET